MKVFEGVAALHEAVGTHIGYSDWFVVSQERVNDFADVTGDHQWIHIDPVRASQNRFGSTVAHGLLTVSLIPRLSGEVYEIRGPRMVVNYGANRIRFPAPVAVGSRIRAGVEIVEVAPTAAGHLITSRTTIERESADKPAAVAELLLLVVE
jgi:acyl dehydratase